MAEPGRLSLRENEEELLRKGLDVTTTKPPGVTGSYPRKYCDTCLETRLNLSIGGSTSGRAYNVNAKIYDLRLSSLCFS